MWYDHFFRDWHCFQRHEDDQELKDFIAAAHGNVIVKEFRTSCGEEYSAVQVKKG